MRRHIISHIICSVIDVFASYCRIYDDPLFHYIFEKKLFQSFRKYFSVIPIYLNSLDKDTNAFDFTELSAHIVLLLVAFGMCVDVILYFGCATIMGTFIQAVLIS